VAIPRTGSGDPVDDHELALTLLKGAYMLRGGLPSLEYFDEGDEITAELRRALARILMDSEPLDRELRLLLALLFLPDDAAPQREDAHAELLQQKFHSRGWPQLGGYVTRPMACTETGALQRKLVFEFRGGPHNPRDTTVRDRFVNYRLVEVLAEQAGMSLPDKPAPARAARFSAGAAIRQVAEEVGLSVPAVRGIFYGNGGASVAATFRTAHASRRKP
jgi:hypothetical protein